MEPPRTDDEPPTEWILVPVDGFSQRGGGGNNSSSSNNSNSNGNFPFQWGDAVYDRQNNRVGQFLCVGDDQNGVITQPGCSGSCTANDTTTTTVQDRPAPPRAADTTESHPSSPPPPPPRKKAKCNDEPEEETTKADAARKNHFQPPLAAALLGRIRFSSPAAASHNRPEAPPPPPNAGSMPDSTEGVVDWVPMRHLVPVYNVHTANTSIPSPKVTVSGVNSDAAPPPRTPTTTPILVTPKTDIFRVLAASQLCRHTCLSSTETTPTTTQQFEMIVLEIGSSTGGTSEIVWNNIHNVAQWIGLDTSSDMVQIVRAKLAAVAKRRCQCEHMDPLQDPETCTQRIRQYFAQGFSTAAESASAPTATTISTTSGKAMPVQQLLTVLLDIGGNREEEAVLRMIQWVRQSFANCSKETNISGHIVATTKIHLHQIIVKSETLHAGLQEHLCNKATALNNPRNSKEEQTSSSVGTDDDNNNTATSTTHAWYKGRLRLALQKSLPRHPLQAAKRFRPGSNSSIYICRYHNYHRTGCSKQKNCPHDHTHCHLCLQPGHIAQQCPLITTEPTLSAGVTSQSLPS